MQEDSFILPHLSRHHLDDVPRPDQACLSMPHLPPALESFCLQPTLNQIKVLAAVVNFPILHPDRLSRLQNCTVLLAPVTGTAKIFSQMNGSIAIMADSQQ